MAEWNDIRENGIFFGGHRKNGTTLFIALLDNHPKLFVYPYQTHFWYGFYPIFSQKKYTLKEKKERVKSFIFGSLKNTVKIWMKLDEADLNNNYEEMYSLFEKRIDESNGTTKDFFDAILFAVRETLPDKNYETHEKWVEKTTSSEIYANEIFDMYPKAKFIQIMRDPRDCWAVIKNGWDKHYKNQYDSMERLLRSVIDRNYIEHRLCFENRKIYGEERYKVLKYEDLINKPERTLKELADFIGINFDGITMQPSFCGIPWEGNSLSNIKYKTISDERIGIYKKMPKCEIKTLEYYFGYYMEKLGYELEYDLEDHVEALADHYKWFNFNQQWSMKPLRTNYDHLKE